MKGWGRLFGFLRNVLALFGLLGLVGGGIAGVLVVKSGSLPPQVLAQKVLQKTGLENTFLMGWLTVGSVKADEVQLPDLNDPDWVGQGASRNRVLPPFFYTDAGRPVPGIWATDSEGAVSGGVSLPGADRFVGVANADELLQAVREAVPGDVITLAPGTYRITKRTISVGQGGSRQQPIKVRAEKLGSVLLELNTLEGFLINTPFWNFENLDIRGICPEDRDCEHAFHVVGDGRGFVLRNSRLHEFNAMIKANGIPLTDGRRLFPDGALIEGNSFFNSHIRNTATPVTLLDVVGADDWIVRENLIADFAKGGGDRISYAAFFKGNSSRGVFENNLVVCEYAHAGGTRVGLSLGGGGTGLEVSRGRDNAVEHTGGIVRNNIVMHCPDVALYLNKAQDTQVWNNTFFNTQGADVRFPASSAVIKNNLLDGRVRERDGGKSVQEHNLILKQALFAEGLSDIFEHPRAGNFHLKEPAALIDKGDSNPLVKFDFCNNPRTGAPDIGAIEYHGPAVCQPFRVAE